MQAFGLERLVLAPWWLPSKESAPAVGEPVRYGQQRCIMVRVMLSISRRFRLKDVMPALPPEAAALEFRFHEPFDKATGAYVAPGPEGPRFIRVSIFPSDRAPTEPGSPSTDAILESAMDTTPPRDVLTYFQSVAEGRFPEGIPESPELQQFFGPINPGDPLPPDREVSDLWMPKGVAAFVDDLHARLVDYARRVGDLFRWTTGAYHVDGSLYTAAGSLSMWSLNGSAARPILPSTMLLTITRMAPPVVPTDAGTQVVQHFGQLGRSAPIADEIIRESWAVRQSNPRSAVVLAMAATEAGFRRLVSDLVPHAEYLVQELQTPPLTQLLKKYLPQLPLRSSPRLAVLPKSVMRKLTKAIELRNNIVHKGAQAPDEQAVEEAVAVASDLVRLFDYYAGNQWALDFVSEGVRSDLH
jgi:hypothetical protein